MPESGPIVKTIFLLLPGRPDWSQGGATAALPSGHKGSPGHNRASGSGVCLRPQFRGFTGSP